MVQNKKDGAQNYFKISMIFRNPRPHRPTSQSLLPQIVYYLYMENLIEPNPEKAQIQHYKRVSKA